MTHIRTRNGEILISGHEDERFTHAEARLHSVARPMLRGTGHTLRRPSDQEVGGTVMSSIRTAGGVAHEPWRSCAGFCGLDVVDQPSGVVTSGEGLALCRLAEQVKLGRDLITEFADRYETFPGRLARTQVRELLAVRTLLDRYGLSDPTAGRTPGRFTDPDVQARYDGLRGAGRADRAAALDAVAAYIRDVIALLGRDLAATTAPDARHTCLHVLAAAHQQLRVLQAWSGR